MHHTDRPFEVRRLAGVDQALGDGRAREPADLLSQLRERLDNLAANHPSAHPDRSEPDEPAESAEPGERPEDSGSGEADSRSRRERPPREQPHGPERQPQANGPGRSDTTAFGEPPFGGGAPPPESAPDGHYALFDPGRAGDGEPYRPWFAADEPGDPWFVE